MVNEVEKWVREQAALARPDSIRWCDGTEEEALELARIGLEEEKSGSFPVFERVGPGRFPGSLLHRSVPSDVARTERLTFLCHARREDAGPANNWMEPGLARERMSALTRGCMKGRRMFVLPFMMGHPDSTRAMPCVQLTDSAYVALSTRVMARVGPRALEKASAGPFMRGLHSLGDLRPDRRFIMHFPDDDLVWSVGSGYGGNALLGKKCIALRMASWKGYRGGWLAEHMVVAGLEDRQGNVSWILAAMPSACGKTNLAMMRSSLPGYRVRTVGDDIAWVYPGADGRLYAQNPEAGFFAVAPGTSRASNPVMMETLEEGSFYPTIFTNTGLREKGREPWWEGLDGPVPGDLVNWRGEKWRPGKGPAAHPNSRLTVSVRQCPTLSAEYDNPAGVPISAILLGSRRSSVVPLVLESRNWQEGVFLGSIMASETTSAAEGRSGRLRADPMAMLPFCGYNMGDYFGHWLDIGRRLDRPPGIFLVNWFRRDREGKFDWPGFGENSRVLKWVVDRVSGRGGARETPVGFVPDSSSFDLSGLDIGQARWDRLVGVNRSEWLEELERGMSSLEVFGGRVPPALVETGRRLGRSLDPGRKSRKRASRGESGGKGK